MSVAGLCQICERARADFQCDRCGSLVCEDHYDARSGLCADCRPGRERDDRDGDPVDDRGDVLR